MDDTYFLKLDATDREYVTRRRDSSDEWDRDDTRTDWTIEGLRFVKMTERYDFVTKTKQDTYWVVLEYYDTGDSFGRDENRMGPQYLAHSREDADFVARKLLSAIKADKSQVEFKDPHTGEQVSLYAHSVGYFERLVGIEVVELSTAHRTRYTLNDIE